MCLLIMAGTGVMLRCGYINGWGCECWMVTVGFGLKIDNLTLRLW